MCLHAYILKNIHVMYASMWAHTCKYRESLKRRKIQNYSMVKNEKENNFNF